jgi:hypothetical protein
VVKGGLGGLSAADLVGKVLGEGKGIQGIKKDDLMNSNGQEPSSPVRERKEQTPNKEKREPTAAP